MRECLLKKNSATEAKLFTTHNYIETKINQAMLDDKTSLTRLTSKTSQTGTNISLHFQTVNFSFSQVAKRDLAFDVVIGVIAISKLA